MPRSASPSLRDAGAVSAIGTPRHFAWLHGIVKGVLVLNLLDAVFTLLWVGAGLAEEANPLMEELVTGHPVLFTLTKLGLVGAGSWLLWRWRTRPLAVVAIFVAFVSYYAVLAHHLGYLGILVGNELYPR